MRTPPLHHRAVPAAVRVDALAVRATERDYAATRGKHAVGRDERLTYAATLAAIQASRSLRL